VGGYVRQVRGKFLGRESQEGMDRRSRWYIGFGAFFIVLFPLALVLEPDSPELLGFIIFPIVGLVFLVMAMRTHATKVYENGIEFDHYRGRMYLPWSDVTDFYDFDEKGIRIGFMIGPIASEDSDANYSVMIMPTFPNYKLVRPIILKRISEETSLIKDFEYHGNREIVHDLDKWNEDDPT
jgi:hypothetical protein